MGGVVVCAVIGGLDGEVGLREEGKREEGYGEG